MNHLTLNEYVARLSDVLNSINLLNWDASTGMPDAASRRRGLQVATLNTFAQQLLLSTDFAAALAHDKKQPGLTLQQRNAHRALDEAIVWHKKIPAELMATQAHLTSVAEVVWREARAKNDFAAFKPYLEKIVELKRRVADAVGYENHPYEALMHEYEPGLKLPALQGLFEQLQSRLIPLARAVHAAPKPDNHFLFRHYPEAQQRQLSTHLATRIGYDFTRGKLDTTTHPFEISMSRDDVRITTRFNPHFINAGLFGTLHEAGHGMYEQNVDPALSDTALTLDLTGLYAVAGASFGLHESQSRLWENRIGRSLTFWQHHFSLLQSTFPGVLEDIDVGQFYRAINRSEPSAIRVEADELTYDFHIMLRVELEIGLIDGSVRVDDLPGLWSEKLQHYLGIPAPDDSHGVLQDIHWSKGMMGSFPTYTLGNVMGAQFMATALQSSPDIQKAINRADYQPLREWLTAQIYQHGRTFQPGELLQRVTGSALDAGPYLGYLEQKYRALYPSV